MGMDLVHMIRLLDYLCLEQMMWLLSILLTDLILSVLVRINLQEMFLLGMLKFKNQLPLLY